MSQPAQTGRRLPWLLFIGLSLTFLAGAYVLRNVLLHQPLPPLPPPEAMLQSATLTNDVKPVPDFSLTTAAGQFAAKDLQGHWTLMFFGYTYCPDICPTTLASMQQLRQQLADTAEALPQMVFVSVDAPRDTPQRLAEFVGFFDPAFIGATGSDDALAALTKHLGVHYQRLQQAGQTDYTVDHSGGIFLIDKQARLKAVFSWPHEVAAMAADYRKIIALADAP